MTLTKQLKSEILNIGRNQPVKAGCLQSVWDGKELIKLGLVMVYENEYVLTSLGVEQFNKLEDL